MEKFTGIDFGMQNLKVCHFNGTRNMRVDLEGNSQSSSKVVANTVYYYENEESILNALFFDAQQAKEEGKWENPDYVRYIKRELQKESSYRSFCNEKYRFSAMKIINDIFRQIAFKMEETGFDTTAPVILTVPVIFSEAQKQKLKYCAEKAGFSVQEIITEPFAALFSEEFSDECIDTDEDESYVLILDMGASTIDICLIRIRNEEDDHAVIETMGSTGLSFGGKDITDMIADFIGENERIQDELQKKGFDIESTRANLFEFAEQLKNELYEEEDVPETDSRDFYGEKFVLKRTNVDKILNDSGIWKKIETMIEEMFDSLDEPVDYEDITKLVMTGGTSRIQYFRDKAENLFPEAEIIGDPEEEDTVYCSVSSGAVNYAKNENIEIRNSSPMCVGISCGNGFQKALNQNSFYYLRGKRNAVSRSWLEANDWKIKVYQTLRPVREHTNVEHEDIYYSGYFQLQKELYPTDEDIIYLSVYCTPLGISAETASGDDLKNYIESELNLTMEVSL